MNHPTQRSPLERLRRRTRFRIYRGNGFIGLTTPRFHIIAIPTLAWLRRGWWYCGEVAGSLIVRAGPFVFTRWERKS